MQESIKQLQWLGRRRRLVLNRQYHQMANINDKYYANRDSQYYGLSL